MNTSLERLIGRLETPLREREEAGLERVLEPRAAAPDALDLCGNDYLGLSRHPAVIDAAERALRTWGASSSASPLLGGYKTVHAELEAELCGWTGFPLGIVWNSGYAANVALLGVLPARGDLIIADKLAHNSMLSGALRSDARLLRFPHNDLAALERLLERESGAPGCVWVATESVYSMDGDSPNMERLAGLRSRHGFIWMLDEAHATGWHGPSGAGLAEEAGVSSEVDILVGTLGKALGSAGAYTMLREPLLRRQLVNHANELIYSTYLQPSAAAAALESVRLVRALGEGGRRGLHRLSREWRAALREYIGSVPEGCSPIIPVPLGDSRRVLACAAAMCERGVLVGAVRPPTVPPGGARLRVSLRARLERAQMDRFLAALKEGLR
ncbi:MAG: 8-amino-7-oxononanoate synthase [Opitutaceae bacterium]